MADRETVGLDPDALHDLAFRHDDYMPAMRSKLTIPAGTKIISDKGTEFYIL